VKLCAILTGVFLFLYTTTVGSVLHEEKIIREMIEK
jgi:hypothetical protein